MKKTFLIAGLIAVLTATNGYAVQSDGLEVTLKCPAGCVLQTSQYGENFGAYCYNNTTHEYCTGPQVIVLDYVISGDVIQEIKKMKKNETVATKKTNMARAARVVKDVKAADTPLMPIDIEPEIQDKVASGSGETVVKCNGDCKIDCHASSSGSYMICKCKKPNGELCQESVHTYEPTIHR